MAINRIGFNVTVRDFAVIFLNQGSLLRQITCHDTTEEAMKDERVEVIPFKDESIFPDDDFAWSHPPIRMCNDLWGHMEMHICEYDTPVDFPRLANDNAGDERTPVAILGCFIGRDPEDIHNPNSVTVAILFSDGECYSPTGNHGNYSRDYLINRSYMISFEDYRKASEGVHTPVAYMHALEDKDPYMLMKQYAINGVMYPSYPEAVKIPIIVEVE